MPTMPSVLEQELDAHSVFSTHVDSTGIASGQQESPSNKQLKTLKDVQSLLSQGRKQDVKQLLRTNPWPVNDPIRRELWKLLCTQHQNSKSNLIDGFYWDMVNQVFGSTELPEKPISLPPFVEPAHCRSYYLTHKGRNVADRVVSVLGYACPDIVYSPSIYPICALLLHYMGEEDCYHCMTSLVSSKEKMFITQTKLLHEVTWKTVMQICKKHVKAAAVHLQRHCPSTRVERIYMDWIWWVLHNLPFAHLVRVMDCFFHEGIKVLYRVAMAILVLFHKQTSASGTDWASDIQKNGIDAALTKFCKELTMPPSKVRFIPYIFKKCKNLPPNKLLKVAFGIRGLSSAYISRVFIRTEMVLKSKTVISGSRQLVRSRSSENLPNSQSQNNIQMVSHTLTIRERMSEETYNEMLLTLWSWLPVRITMYQPILLYTTEEHGCSLTTFYVRVEHHEPTLLMIKTCNNEVFGAYCSSKWGERNMKDDRGNRQAYFGTGETFLFSLYPERAKYPWVGMDGDRHLGHGSELFMAADSKMITIGGGEGQAIWMDENIRFGKTDRCQTFNNPPLCPSGDFEIRVLEVYGFATEQLT